MEPIISPWVLYLLFMFDRVVSVLIVINTLVSICLLMFLVFCLIEEKFDHIKKYLKYFLYILIPSMFILLFMPTSKEFAIIILSNYVTQNNVKAVGNLVIQGKEELKDDVLEIIKNLNETDNKLEKEKKGE